MARDRSLWKLVVILVIAALVIPIVLFLPEKSAPLDDPWVAVPDAPAHTDHAALLPGPYEDGPAVTLACLECHAEEGEQVLHTVHWLWEGEPVSVPGHSEPVRMGKKNVINNFCISIQSNWVGCSSCHAGYGWEDDTFDFGAVENIDCLVCHDQSGQYAKTRGGWPAEGVDLAAAAQSVGAPTRDNCGGCHFRGGGDAVKHGDLDATLTNPTPRVDVHMGEHDLQCVDCHRTEDHVIRGRSLSVSIDAANQALCTDCHSERPHADQRVNDHLSSVACATCHVPAVAIREATKTHWDWSEAGQDIEESPHEYLKKKGRFEYEQDLIPAYAWFNGTADRHLMGDVFDPSTTLVLNPPLGGIGDSTSKIWPFKVHRATQIYDVVNRHLLVPKTVGEGGYWTDFDWDQAARLGSEVTGLEYSGEFGWAETEMYWPLAHMVQSAEKALQCTDCHGDDGRMDWAALGYPGDPVDWGGRDLRHDRGQVQANLDGPVEEVER